jgi:hypothetical protein
MIDRPWRTGKFIITAGLKPLEDKAIFPFEKDLERYLANKKAARLESLEKLYPPHVGLTPDEIDATARTLRALIKKDQPGFEFKEMTDARDEIDWIVSQIPEDFSVWKMEDNREWLALIHLSSPNHWDARKKNGKSFFDSHAPIPQIDAISKAAPKMFEQIQKRGAVERFAWGVATDDRLNHHPEAPHGVAEDEWKGRSFNTISPELFIRMERQTLFPITEKLIGFTIKTSFCDVSTLPTEDLILIAQCIEGMDTEILKYKGLVNDRDPILNWIYSLIQSAHQQTGMSFATLSP